MVFALLSGARATAACELGDAILQYRPLSGMPYAADLAFSADTDVESLPFAGVEPASRSWSASRPSNLFKACPALATRLPVGVRLATEHERAAASRPIAAPGEPPLEPVTVFAVGAPAFDRRLRDALVSLKYACPGLCGGLSVVRYRKVEGRWMRWDQPRLLRVS